MLPKPAQTPVISNLMRILLWPAAVLIVAALSSPTGLAQTFFYTEVAKDGLQGDSRVCFTRTLHCGSAGAGWRDRR